MALDGCRGSRNVTSINPWITGRDHRPSGPASGSAEPGSALSPARIGRPGSRTGPDSGPIPRVGTPLSGTPTPRRTVRNIVAALATTMFRSYQIEALNSRRPVQAAVSWTRPAHPAVRESRSACRTAILRASDTVSDGLVDIMCIIGVASTPLGRGCPRSRGNQALT